MAVLGLHFALVLCLVVADGGYPLVEVHGLLIAVDAPIVEQGLRCTGSIAMAHGLSCPKACGIFLDQGSNPVPCIGRWVVKHWGPPGKSLGLLLSGSKNGCLRPTQEVSHLCWESQHSAQCCIDSKVLDHTANCQHHKIHSVNKYLLRDLSVP